MDFSRGPKLFDDDFLEDPDWPRGPDSAHDLRIQGVKSPERTPLAKLKPIRVAASSTSQSVDSKKPPKGRPRKPDLIKIKHKVAMPSINIAFGNPSISSKEALVASNNSVISINAANAHGAVYRSKNTLYKMNNTAMAANVTITSKVPPTPILRTLNSNAAEMNSLMSRYTNADGTSIYQMVKKGPETSAEEMLRYHTRLVDSPNNTSYYESVDLEYNPAASVASSATTTAATAAPQPPSDPAASAGLNSSAFPKRLHRFKKTDTSFSHPTEIHDETHMMDIMTHIKPAGTKIFSSGEEDVDDGNQHRSEGALIVGSALDGESGVGASVAAAAAVVASRPSTKGDGINFDDEEVEEEERDNFDETAAHHEEVPLVSRRASVNPYFNKSTLHRSLSPSHQQQPGIAESVEESSQLQLHQQQLQQQSMDGFARGLDPNLHLGDKDTLMMAEIAMHSLWDGEHLNSHFTPLNTTSNSSSVGVAGVHAGGSSVEDKSSEHRGRKSPQHRSHSTSATISAATAPATGSNSKSDSEPPIVIGHRSPSPPPRNSSPTSAAAAAVKLPASLSVVIPEIKPEAASSAALTDSPQSVQRKHHHQQTAAVAASTGAQNPPHYQNKKPAGSPNRSHAFLRNNLIKAYNLPPMLKLEALSDRELRQGPASHRDTSDVTDGKQSAAALVNTYQSVSARDSVEARILPHSMKSRIVIPSHTTNDPNNETGKKSVRIKNPKVHQHQQPATQAVANRILRKGPATNVSTLTTTIVTDYYDLLKGSKQVASTAVQILTSHTQPPTLSDTVAASETLQSVTGLETPAATAPTTVGLTGGLGPVTVGGLGKHILHVTSLDLDLDNANNHSIASNSTFKSHISNVVLTRDAQHFHAKNKHTATDKHRHYTENSSTELSSFAAGVSAYESYASNHDDDNTTGVGGGGHKFIKIVAPVALDDEEAELMASEYVLRPSTHHAPTPKTHAVPSVGGVSKGGGGGGEGGGSTVLDDSYDSSLEEADSPTKGTATLATTVGGPMDESTSGVVAVAKRPEPVVAQAPLDIISNEANAAILTQYEYEEILDFKEVYFFGHDKYLKIQPHILIPELFLLSDENTQNEEGGMLTSGESSNELKIHTTSENRVISGVFNDPINGIFNNGFDNEDTTYIATKGDHVGYRYELLSSLGKGSFGDVFECLDHKTGKHVAVKIIKSKARFQEQGAHELAMLDYVRPSGHREVRVKQPASYYTHSYHKEEPGLIPVEKYPLINNIIVQYSDSFMFRNHRCFVFPMYSHNLYEYMKLKNFAGLPVSFVKKVAVQLLEALKYLRSIDVVHCDLKPENILIRDENTVSIVMIDFGSSCKVNESKYMYIQSRFYRAPEVLMGIPYSFPIDMWSLACILPELRTSYPAFPGESERDQVAVIAEVLGEPPYSMYTQCTKKKELYNEFYKLVLYISPLGRDRQLNSRTMSSLINARAQDQLFVSFIAAILQWLPERRLTPSDALRHPWLLDKHDSSSYFDSDATFQALAKGGAVSELLNNSVDILLKDESHNGNSSSAKQKEKSDLEKMEEFIEVFKFDDLSAYDENQEADLVEVEMMQLQQQHQQEQQPLGTVVHPNAAEIAEEAGVELMQTIEEEEGESSAGGAPSNASP